jgi:hypothetical protein
MVVESNNHQTRLERESTGPITAKLATVYPPRRASGWPTLVSLDLMTLSHKLAVLLIAVRPKISRKGESDCSR